MISRCDQQTCGSSLLQLDQQNVHETFQLSNVAVIISAFGQRVDLINKEDARGFSGHRERSPQVKCRLTEKT